LSKLNATLEDNVIKVYDSVNICVAVDAPYGLVTPVIRDVDKKSVADLVTEYEDVVSRARAGQLKEKDLWVEHYNNKLGYAGSGFLHTSN